MKFFKKTKKYLYLLITFLNFGLAKLSLAQEQQPDQFGSFINKTPYPVSTGATNLAQIVGRGIRAFLGVLGIVFVLLLIYGGFKWMTAGGDEEDVKIAKAYLKNALIGIIIVLGAYIITYFVFKALIGSAGFYTPEYQ